MLWKKKGRNLLKSACLQPAGGTKEAIGTYQESESSANNSTFMPWP